MWCIRKMRKKDKYFCPCGDSTENENGVCDTCKALEEMDG